MSEEAILLKNPLKSLKFLARASGFTLESKKRKLKHKIRDRFVFVINFLWMNSDLLGAIYWFLDGLASGKSFVNLTYIAPCITLSFIANFKRYILLTHEDDICDLIDELRQLEIQLYGRERVEDTIWREETRFLNIVIKISNILNFTLLLSFAVSPLVLIAYNYLTTGEIDLILPFLIVYPFDSQDIKYWPFVYLHQIWSECLVVTSICFSDYLFWVCCTYIRIQFRLVQNKVEGIVDRNSSLERAQSDFIEVITQHQQSIRLVEKLEFVYTKSTLCNFISSSVVICLTGFNVMAVEDVAYAVMFLVFLFSSLMQIFVLCFFGDMLMSSSVEVAEAVYRSKWYEAKADLAKNLLLMLIRAQKPCKLTALGYADVNLRAFTKILSTAWSYFALLKTMYSTPHGL